jgi:hypothetical protein
MKTEFRFNSTAFNCTEPKDYFINGCCFGDDLTKWLIGRLKQQGLEVDPEPGQEDFGWFLFFGIDGERYTVIVGFQPNEPETGDQWMGWIERRTGLLGMILRKNKNNISPNALKAIEQALHSPEIKNLSWHENNPQTVGQ